MKTILPLGLSLAAAISFLLPATLSAQIINIDFRGYRGSEAIPGSYSGPGFPGNGNSQTFSDIFADNSALIPNPLNLPVGGTGPGTPTDNISVSATNLLDYQNHATSVGFAFTTPVGADNSGIGVLNGSYIFFNSANNVLPTANFTISGLGTATTADIILYTVNFVTPAVLFDSVPTSYTKINDYTFEYDNVAVTNGTILGTIGANDGGLVILSGLSLATDVPEPSTWALMAMGAGALLWRLRRRESVQ